MIPKELTIHRAQAVQPWTVPYSEGVLRAVGEMVPHILASHAVLHAAKSVGKLASVFEKLDHGQSFGPGDKITVAQMSSDLFTVALRLANLYGFDLATVLVSRVEEKNGISILEDR